MVKIKKIEHNGANYLHFVNESNVDAICCVGEKRFVFNGKPKISIMENSWKFGKQIQFSLICPKGILKAESRNNSKWNVVEIDIPFEDGKRMIEKIYNELFSTKQKLLNN